MSGVAWGAPAGTSCPTMGARQTLSSLAWPLPLQVQLPGPPAGGISLGACARVPDGGVTCPRSLAVRSSPLPAPNIALLTGKSMSLVAGEVLEGQREATAVQGLTVLLEPRRLEERGGRRTL